MSSQPISLNNVMEALTMVMESVGQLTDRMAKLETRRPTTTAKPSNNLRPKKKVVQGTTMPRGNFLKTVSTVFQPVKDNKTAYNKVEAVYSFDGGKTWTKKTFWGRKKMARHDWAMYKLHGEFGKKLDA